MRHVSFLALLFLTLLCLVIWKEATRPEAGALSSEVELVPVRAIEFKADDCARIEVAGPDGDGSFVLVNRDGRWLSETPFEAPAAAGVVTSLIEGVIAARGELRIDDGAKLAKFDVSPDRATTVRMTNAAGSVLADLAIGRNSGPSGAFVRLLRDGANKGAVYAVTADLRSALGLPRTAVGATEPATPDVTHFYDLSIPELAIDGTQELHLSTPLWSLKLGKESGVWNVTAGGPAGVPFKARGAQDIVSQLAGALSASGLVDPARRDEVGLDAPQYEVAVVLADGKERRAFGARDAEGEKFYVRLDSEQQPDVVYECESWQWRRLFPQGSVLFEFPALGGDDADVDRVAIARLGTSQSSTELVRPGGPGTEWTIRSPQWGLAPARSPINTLTSLLRSARAVDWSSTPPSSMLPEITISYGRADADDADLQRILIGPTIEGREERLAVLPNLPNVTVVIANATAERLAPDALELFADDVLHELTQEDIVSVRVKENGAESFRIDRKADKSWELVTGEVTSKASPVLTTLWMDELFSLAATDRTDYPTPAEVEVELVGDLGASKTIGLSKYNEGSVVHLTGATFMVETTLDRLVADPETLRVADDPPPEDDTPEDDTPEDDTEE